MPDRTQVTGGLYENAFGISILHTSFTEGVRGFQSHLPKGQIMQIVAYGAGKRKSLQNAIFKADRLLGEEK